MAVCVYSIDDELELAPVDPDSAAEACGSDEARIWIDVQSRDPHEVVKWLDRLEVDGLSRRLCLEARDRPGFYPLKSVVFLAIPVPIEGEDEAAPERDYLAFLCRENLLLTLHGEPIRDLELLATLEGADSWLPERSIAGLVSAVLIVLSRTCLNQAMDLRQSILELEDRMDREPDDVDARDIQDLRSELLALGSITGDQLPPLKGLTEMDRPSLRLAGAREYLNCALANALATDGSLTWLDGRVNALRSSFEMHAQDRTNRRLGSLTILSAIFMPITLLAGIWGMNFEGMPELGIPYGYPIALGVMALIGTAMGMFFRRTGWLD